MSNYTEPTRAEEDEAVAWIAKRNHLGTIVIAAETTLQDAIEQGAPADVIAGFRKDAARHQAVLDAHMDNPPA